jgi:hypothetical protein
MSRTELGFIVEPSNSLLISECNQVGFHIRIYLGLLLIKPKSICSTCRSSVVVFVVNYSCMIVQGKNCILVCLQLYGWTVRSNTKMWTESEDVSKAGWCLGTITRQWPFICIWDQQGKDAKSSWMPLATEEATQTIVHSLVFEFHACVVLVLWIL